MKTPPRLLAARLGAALWAIWLAGLPVGCAVGPDFTRPEPPTVTTYTGNADETSRQLASGPGEPEQQFAVGQRISTEWWELFQSAQISEAVLLSVIGGGTGILTGSLVSRIISAVAGWPTLLSPTAMAIAFLFSAAVGVFFGYYPARRASLMNPIEALRYE